MKWVYCYFLTDCLLRVAREEGIAALWAGTGPSVMLAANPALQFMVYDALKRYARGVYHVEVSGSCGCNLQSFIF